MRPVVPLGIGLGRVLGASMDQRRAGEADCGQRGVTDPVFFLCAVLVLERERVVSRRSVSVPVGGSGGGLII